MVREKSGKKAFLRSGIFEIAQVKVIFGQKSGNIMMKGHWSYNYSHLVTHG